MTYSSRLQAERTCLVAASLLLLLGLTCSAVATAPATTASTATPRPHAGMADLPPLLEFANGTAVTSPAALQARQAEIRALLSQYYYGTFPTTAPPLTAARVESNTTQPGRGHSNVVVELHFNTSSGGGGVSEVRFTIELLLPTACSVTAPCPLFLTQTNHRRWALVALARGYAALVYPGADSNDQTDGFRAAYPTATWGLIARRAWLGSRALDYAITLPGVDPNSICITGHSRNGKQSLILAAWDSRIAAVISSSSGAPAMSPYRFTSAYTFSESPGSNWGRPPPMLNCSCPRDTSDPRPADPRCCWWLPSVVDYEGRENELPIDSHALLALVAPRAVASECAHNDPCDPSFAVERSYLAGKTVYAYLNATERLHLIWRPGQHHGFESMPLYFDWFDAALGRGSGSLSDFSEVLIHHFDWEAWNASTAYVAPPPRSAPVLERVSYGLGEIQPLGWSPGGEYGLLDYDYIPLMLGEGSGLLDTAGGVTRMAINFGKYVHGMLYYSAARANASKAPLPAVVWLHPYSYQSGYVEDYSRNTLRTFDRLALAGYVVLAYDQAAFGQRLLEKADFYRRAANRQGSLLGEIVQDASSAFDALASAHNGSFPDGLPLGPFYNGQWYPAVNASRIYVAGYALGGVAATYAAALDSRFAGAAALSALTPLRNDSLARTVGGNARLYRWHALQPRLGWFQDPVRLNATWPYDYDDVLGLVAPRPALVAVQEHDRTCNLDALRPLLEHAGHTQPRLNVTYLNSTSALDDGLTDVLVSWLQSL